MTRGALRDETGETNSFFFKSIFERLLDHGPIYLSRYAQYFFRHYVPPRRVKMWGFSLSELLADPLGRRHFTRFLEKEISAENLG